ncbi:DUF3311 domain-containing protein [Brevibacillus nitrificans]|uniref:DUF3311 domain-containing protein n=1 Tax=Brevibacillus nitrificans TaxID=651560 RepID=A0A3M8DM07_9BACL|nr:MULTISPECIES: DUF3311 domain-containing protein [Brevibacillus]MED1949552.1 DUF3311 domain-containing protein [Brevibacillus centrosporus]RNB88455.1 DUF3311 domain-containing protein [Brevibacillus nitrificans]
MKPLYLLAIIPVIAIFGGVFWANTVTPYVLGMPFFFFWNFAWFLLTSFVVYIIYRFDPVNRGSED